MLPTVAIMHENNLVLQHYNFMIHEPSSELNPLQIVWEFKKAAQYIELKIEYGLVSQRSIKVTTIVRNRSKKSMLPLKKNMITAIITV